MLSLQNRLYYNKTHTLLSTETSFKWGGDFYSRCLYSEYNYMANNSTDKYVIATSAWLTKSNIITMVISSVQYNDLNLVGHNGRPKLKLIGCFSIC